MFIVQAKGGRIVSRIVFSFYLVKNQKIATNSTTTEDKEKNKHRFVFFCEATFANTLTKIWQ
jgi:hypothetical protein